jgi:hypothetical protein
MKRKTRREAGFSCFVTIDHRYVVGFGWLTANQTMIAAYARNPGCARGLVFVLVQVTATVALRLLA